MRGSEQDISTHSLTFGRTKIPFNLEFRPKRRLSITVMPNRKVVVLAPEGQELDKILTLVKRRAGWIVKKRDYFEQFHPLAGEKRFVSGETHLYLGRQYRLKVRRRRESGVKLIGRYFLVAVEDPSDRKMVKNALESWYIERAKKVFEGKVNDYLKNHPSLKLALNKMTIKRMEKRWGSCTKAGNIRLNLDLIKVSLYCIEYVIAHELCHLKIHDHSPAFYRLLRHLVPDWEKRKARLDAFAF